MATDDGIPERSLEEITLEDSGRERTTRVDPERQGT